MKLPIPFIKEVPDFKSRPTLISGENVHIDDRKLLEAIDRLEQKVDFANEVAVNAWNGMVIVAAAFLLIQGQQIWNFIHNWSTSSHIGAVMLSWFGTE